MTLSGRNLTCERNERVIFAGLDFDLEVGGALLLRGPNGSGKSSLLRVAAGFLASAQGHVLWDGVPIDRETHGARIAWIGHLDAVKPALSVRENLRFWTRLGGGADVEGSLRAVGLDSVGGLPAAWLSAGQRRRLNLARLAASSAPLWLLDEPTVSLDNASVAQLNELVEGHLARGGAALVATHADLPFGSATLSLGGER